MQRVLPVLFLPALLSGCAAVSADKEPKEAVPVVRSAECRWAGSPIRINGVLDEAAWDRAPHRDHRPAALG
jgi:hypothetical protein